PASRGQHGAPVLPGELVGPDAPSSVHVPGLQLTDVRGALPHAHADLGSVDAEVELANLVRLTDPLERAAEVLVGGDIQVTRVRVVGGGRPVLASPEARAERDRASHLWLPFGIVAGPPGLRIDALENFLRDERLGVDEADPVRAALEQPQVAVPPRMNEALDRPPIAADVD